MSRWPDWSGETVICIGGGPSLTEDQVDYCHGKGRVIAINDAYRLAPWADMLYAADGEWWRYHEPDFKGIRVAPAREKVDSLVSVTVIGDPVAPGLSTDPAKVHYGTNSGYQAINVAYHCGSRRVVLIGYDMRTVQGRMHWFGQHPDPVRKKTPLWPRFIEAFETIVPQLPSLGLEIINCTPGSNLKCFPLQTLASALR